MGYKNAPYLLSSSPYTRIQIAPPQLSSLTDLIFNMSKLLGGPATKLLEWRLLGLMASQLVLKMPCLAWRGFTIVCIIGVMLHPIYLVSILVGKFSLVHD